MYSASHQLGLGGGFLGRLLAAAMSASLMVATIAGAGVANAQPLCDFADGAGTSDDPFLVANERDLNELRTCDTGLAFLQTADIVLTSANWQPITNHNVADSFGGLYDGGNHSISNLTIDSDLSNRGLFYALNSASILNLTLSGSVEVSGSSAVAVGLLAGSSDGLSLENITVNASINAPDISLVGGIVGIAQNTSVLDTRVNGTLVGSVSVGGAIGAMSSSSVNGLQADVQVTGGSRVGGMFGTINIVAASNSSAHGDVSASGAESGGFASRVTDSALNEIKASGRVDGQDWTGGLIGIASGSAISKSGASGQVFGRTFVGGYIGQARTSAISTAYALGDVTGSAFVGGFAGDLAGGPNQGDGLSVSNAYAAGDVNFRELGFVTGNIGGFAGVLGPRFSSAATYAAGRVDDSLTSWGGYVGGFADTTSVSIAAALYDADLNTQARPAGDVSGAALDLIGKTSAELRDLETYSPAFQIEAGQGVVGQGQKVWGICPGVNDGLPFLNWAVEPGACDQAAADIAAAQQAEANRLAAEQAARERAARELAEQQAEAERQAAAREAALSLGLHVWVSAYGSNQAKFYARELVGAGKVQFYLNGVELGWVRAADRSDPKLRSLPAGPLVGEPYFVRTANLELAHKNILEIYVEGQRVHRVAYTR